MHDHRTKKEMKAGVMPLPDPNLNWGKGISDLPDSGERREFDTGSVRDIRTGKGRYDLLSPFVTERDAKHMEAGAIKYNDRNWEKGQPLMSYLDSAKRHLEAYIGCLLLGEEEKEDHLAAVRWNIAAFIHTEEMIKRGLLPLDLDDRPGPQPKIKDKPYNDSRNVLRKVDTEELADILEERKNAAEKIAKDRADLESYHRGIPVGTKFAS